jgi:hypothetical protein
MTRTSAAEAVSKMPEEFSIEDIIERLIVLEKIEKGRQQVKEGKINTEEQAREKLAKWLS